MKIEAVSTDGARAVSTYSPAILASGQKVLFISGQVPPDLKAPVDVQVRQTFQAIGELLKAAGATYANVTMVRAYFVHLQRDLEAFRRVRLEFLAAPYPACTAVGVTELALPGQALEIEATAVL